MENVSNNRSSHINGSSKNYKYNSKSNGLGYFKTEMLLDHC